MTQSLFNCRNFADLAKIHTQYVQQSFDRMIHSANLMTQEAALMGRDMNKPMQDKMEEWMNMARGAGRF